MIVKERNIYNRNINYIYIFQGHDTTAAASSFFLCVMADRPDIQVKLKHS